MRELIICTRSILMNLFVLFAVPAALWLGFWLILLGLGVIDFKEG